MDPTTQLNGWKEIAAFFGKSPRTVQRWEAKLRLPVHRIKTPGGEIVFALRPELEAWRDTGGGLGASEHDEEADDTPVPEGVGDAPETSRPGPHRVEPAITRRTPPWLPAVAAGVALLLLTAAGVAWRATRPGPLATASFEGSTIVARDLAGRTLWVYQFDLPLWKEPSPVRNTQSFVAGDPPRLADVDRDGSLEVLAVATYGDIATGESQEQELVCISAGGRELWRYRPALSYTFAGRTFNQSWRFLDILVAEGTRRPAVWVSLAASPWWPTVLVRLDAGGTPEVRFVHSGALYVLRQHTGPRGWRLLAGGVNNEYEMASLVVLDEQGTPATSLQTEDSPYRCDNCPTGTPQGVFLFPRSDIHVAEGVKPYNWVWDIRQAEGGVEVLTLESREYSAFRYYHLSAHLEPQTVMMSDSTAHAVLERSGRLDHPDARCPWRRDGVTIRHWSPETGWQDRHVPSGH